MYSVDEFLQTCHKAIADYDSRRLTLHEAAATINNSPFEYPFKEEAHPMLYKIAALAFDVGEDYRSKEDNEADWALLTQTLRNYLSGDWESTCWILTAMYGEYDGDKLTYSLSLAVRRQNGKVVLETASDEIKEAITKTIKHINEDQTDERYLQNLAKLAPTVAGKYKLVNIGVDEYMVEPYYATLSDPRP